MTGIAQGSADGPKKIFGKENVNWQGATRAQGSAVSGSRNDAVSDFTAPKVSLAEAGMDTKLRDIDFSEYTRDEPLEEYGNYELGEPNVTRVYMEDNQLVMEEEWNHDTERDMCYCLDVDVTDFWDYLEVVGLSCGWDDSYNIHNEEMYHHLNENTLG